MSKTELPPICGLWSGVYRYDFDDLNVPFSAWINSQAEALVGTTLEPNTFAPPQFEELSAEIAGQVIGRQVIFYKRYDPSCGAHPETVSYFGKIDDDGQSIEGSWRMSSRDDVVEGWFRMWRVQTSANARKLNTAIVKLSR